MTSFRQEGSIPFKSSNVKCCGFFTSDRDSVFVDADSLVICSLVALSVVAESAACVVNANIVNARARMNCLFMNSSNGDILDGSFVHEFQTNSDQKDLSAHVFLLQKQNLHLDSGGYRNVNFS